MKRKYTQFIISTIIFLLVIGFIIYQARHATHVSEDSLGAGIGQRWEAGLPDGYEKQSAEDVGEDGKGFAYAKLSYDKDLTDLLAKWQPADSAAQAQFDEIADAHLQADVSEEHKAVIRENRPAVTDGWLWYWLEKDNGAKIVLLYDGANRQMYVAERQP